MSKLENPLQALQDLVDQYLQPAQRMIWLGLGFLPGKQNAVFIDPSMLPTDPQCIAVRGLDVIVLIKGYTIQYGILKRLCDSLWQASPRRLQVHDLDFNKAAYLRIGGDK